MFGLTPAHLVIILVIALVVIGPGKLPEVGGAIGKSIREFQKAAGQITEPTPASQAAPVQPAAPAAPMQPMAPMPPAQSYYAAQPVYGAPQQPQYGAPAYPQQQAPQYGAPAYPVAPQYGAPAYPVAPQYGAPAYPVNPVQPMPMPMDPAAVAQVTPPAPTTELPPAGPRID
jgi:TatA/E family protein of Tat protein translocase